MLYHEWGDEDFDWKDLDEAMQYIYINCKRYARVGLQLKEKYGTLRVCTTCAFFNNWPIHSLIYPGHFWYKWSGWIMRLEFKLSGILEKLYIGNLIRKYQVFIVKFFWKRAARKWPHIAEEILDEYDWTFK